MSKNIEIDAPNTSPTDAVTPVHTFLDVYFNVVRLAKLLPCNTWFCGLMSWRQNFLLNRQPEPEAMQRPPVSPIADIGRDREILKEKRFPNAGKNLLTLQEPMT